VTQPASALACVICGVALDPHDYPFCPACAEEPPAVCDVCGCELESEDCWQCFGEGWFDLYEDNPVEYEPGDEEPCNICDGTGRLSYCPDAKHHPEVTP
jgi:hypothetical protein